MKTKSGSDEILRCSFCHKSQDAVAKLISSPSDYPRAYICDECVAVCNSILEDDRTATPPAELTVLYRLITLVTGPLWARRSWGTCWIWDARITASLPRGLAPRYTSG